MGERIELDKKEGNQLIMEAAKLDIQVLNMPQHGTIVLVDVIMMKVMNHGKNVASGLRELQTMVTQEAQVTVWKYTLDSRR